MVVREQLGSGMGNISKPSYYFTLLSVFEYFIRIISLLSYYYTLLSQLSHLQFLDYYTLLYALNNLYYYTHYLIPIIPIILFRDYYFNYRYYSTIIPIILKYYYTNYLFCSLLYVLFAFLHYYPIPIFCIMRIIRIIDIIISFCYNYKFDFISLTYNYNL